ncbi:hypothetical protein BDC45DRAFT_206071 [Circinella umbellata]|nr:hypothetical protein BDC45DRAFT_206071 [Circinella umbellata]
MEDPRQKSKHQSSDEEQEQESIISQESGQRPHDQQQYSCRKEPAVFVVDRIVMDYALSCKYHDPSQSLVLDLGDENWAKVFSEYQLDRSNDYGEALFPPLPPNITKILDDIAKLETPLEAYHCCRALDLGWSEVGRSWTMILLKILWRPG